MRENVLSSLARIYIEFLNVSVLSVYITVVYIQRHTISNNRELHWLYVYEDVIWDLKTCVSEIKYQKYTNRILKEIAVLECENGKSSKLARSHNLFIDFLNVSVLSDTVVYSAIPYEKIKAYMFLRRSLASLARAYKLHVWLYDFLVYVGTFGGLPPPHTKKLATLLLPAFAHQKSGQMKMADSPPPPHSLYEIAATASIYISMRHGKFYRGGLLVG